MSFSANHYQQKLHEVLVITLLIIMIVLHFWYTTFLDKLYTFFVKRRININNNRTRFVRVPTFHFLRKKVCTKQVQEPVQKFLAAKTKVHVGHLFFIYLRHYNVMNVLSNDIWKVLSGIYGLRYILWYWYDQTDHDCRAACMHMQCQNWVKS